MWMRANTTQSRRRGLTAGVAATYREEEKILPIYLLAFHSLTSRPNVKQAARGLSQGFEPATFEL